MLDSACAETDGIRDGNARARPVCDDDEAVEAEEIAATVRLGVEALTEPSRTGTDEQPAEPPRNGRAELRAQRIEECPDRPLQRLQSDVSGEPVRNDDIGPPCSRRTAGRTREAAHVPRS
jgi:hypothetical protein